MIRKSTRRFLADRRGTSAVEFAIVFPIFLAGLFGIITFGSYLAVMHGVQQIAAEAARASLAGLTDTERASLAQNNISANVAAYPLITPSKLALDSAQTDSSGNTFTVTLRYDAAGMFVFNLPQFVPTPSPTIVRSAAIQRGGY